MIVLLPLLVVQAGIYVACITVAARKNRRPTWRRPGPGPRLRRYVRDVHRQELAIGTALAA